MGFIASAKQGPQVAEAIVVRYLSPCGLSSRPDPVCTEMAKKKSTSVAPTAQRLA
jgi:hypothetical protein